MLIKDYPNPYIKRRTSDETKQDPNRVLTKVGELNGCDVMLTPSEWGIKIED